MRRFAVALVTAVAGMLVACQDPSGFQATQTRVVRRAGMTDDRPAVTLTGAAAATAWQTLVRTRVATTLGNADILVVAGGGGGGGSTSGGGGGGGVIYQTAYALTPATSYSVTVGAGGLGSQISNNGAVNGTNGGNSAFGTLTAIGGGTGASGKPSGSRNALAGGSGGGGGYYYGNDIIPMLNAAGTAGQGYPGGSVIGTGTAYWGGAGGGGAGGPGANFDRDVPDAGGAGGPGVACSISGSSAYYGGGGGGGQYVNSTSPGGIGGGGNGGDGEYINATSGAPNTGGGGGGNGRYQYGAGGGNGGSGIVIVRIPGTVATVGGTKTTVGGYTLHTFATTGTTTFTTP
jgi:hypothetical protein